MTTVGLLFTLQARPGGEDEVERFLEADLAGALADLPLANWSALRFDALRFGVLLAFDPVEGQTAHVGDHVAHALREELALDLAGLPAVEGFEIVAGEPARAGHVR
jgi:hypothetical protein